MEESRVQKWPKKTVELIVRFKKLDTQVKLNSIKLGTELAA